jgi:3-isopropylmalate dehydrogenase
MSRSTAPLQTLPVNAANRRDDPFGAMMMRHTFNQKRCRAHRGCGQACTKQGYRTADIHESGTRKVGTEEMGDAVVAALQA